MRINSLVRFKRGKYSDKDEAKYYSDLIGATFIFLGEIANQPGHCILIRVGEKPDFPGTFELFRHTEDFEEIPEDEL